MKYAMSMLVNFNTIRDMILGITTDDIVTVHTNRKIKWKKRERDGTGLLCTDVMAVVSEPEKNVYHVTSHQLARLGV
jgi:hypothetical protein